jgi:hypothetical protein
LISNVFLADDDNDDLIYQLKDDIIIWMGNAVIYGFLLPYSSLKAFHREFFAKQRLIYFWDIVG